MEDVEKIIARHKTDDPLWLEIQLALLLGKIDREEALKRAGNNENLQTLAGAGG